MLRQGNTWPCRKSSQVLTVNVNSSNQSMHLVKLLTQNTTLLQ